jgi:hypothetical protein
MRLKAYILAADPNWIETSVLSYYGLVEEIVVSYDRNGVGWSGHPIPMDECLGRLRAIDKDKKMCFIGGDYYRPRFSPMENDTHQRQCSIDKIGNTADWIIELDTDEILPNAKVFVERLAEVPKDRIVVEWPMRVFFQRTNAGRFLEVTTFLRQQLTEYPGPVATRPGVRLDCARRSSTASKWRFDIRRKNYDLETKSWYVADSVIPKNDAILHFSWVRSEADILRKVRGWGHATDFKGDDYFEKVWKVAPQKWPFLYNFHPVWPRRWQALWPVSLNKRFVGP